MKIAVVGGRLQGLEALYLSKSAGFKTALIDKDRYAPAKNLADEFHCEDLTIGGASIFRALKPFDLILPATENPGALRTLKELAQRRQMPVAFDFSSHAVSSSKIESNQLFIRNGIPVPKPWPQCGFPAILKPSNRSGSAGVFKVTDRLHLDILMAQAQGEMVIQEFLPGPSYSLEVMGHQGSCTCFEVVKLEFDAVFDCKRVVAGPDTGVHVSKELNGLGERIGEALGLSGIMDIEVIESGSQLKVLEIDARLPSQTPTAVYYATGTNLVKILATYWLDRSIPPHPHGDIAKRAVLYEHFRFRNAVLEIAGEHVLTNAQGLEIYENLFSADIFISNFERSPEDWVATAVFMGETEAEAWGNHHKAVEALHDLFGAKDFRDPVPC